MSFLAPLWLLLAGAVAVPLVLHLMRRRIDNQFSFPAVRYLLRAERENVRQLRMRNLLLMMLRVLAILFLALAAARPVGRLIGAGHVPSAVAIVLDNSMSSSAIVDGTPVLARLKEAARAIIEGANSSDRLWLVTADGTVVGGSQDAVRDALERADAFGGRGDLSAAITRAAGLVLASGVPSRSVAVATDGQATALPQQVAVGDVRVTVFTTSGTAPANRAVIAAEARPARWSPRGTVLGRTVGADTATYRVTLGARTMARGVGRAGEEISVRAEPTERGWQRGFVEITADELRTDDTRHFAVWIGAAPAVRVLPGAGAFVQNAIDALVQNQRVTLGSEIEIGPADAVSRLPALLLPPSDPVRLGAANRALERLGVPWRFGNPRRGETLVRGTGFEGVSATLHYPLAALPAAAAETLATAAGEPWMASGDRYVVIASPIDPAASTFPLRASFLPWLGDVVGQRLAGDATVVVNAAPGTTVRLPMTIDGLEGDEGQTTPIRDRTVDAPLRPGVYFLRGGAERAGALVVNPEPEESDLRRLDPRALEARINAAETAIVSDLPQWQRTVFAAGSRRPLQPSFLFLALACLIAELVLVRRDDRPRLVRAAA